MLGDVVLGLALLALGLFVFEIPALAVGGAALACIGLGLALIYRTLARRSASPTLAAKRRGPHELRR